MDKSDGPLETAATFAEQGNWSQVVSSAREAAVANPEDGAAYALLALGLSAGRKTSDAVVAARQAVDLAPGLALAHYALGLTLQTQDPVANGEEAMRCFITAFQLDPSFDPARLAIIEAIKTRSAVYRLVFGLTDRAQSLQPTARWLVLIGLFLAFRVINSVLRSQPELAPVLVPVLATYVLFVVTSWIATPLSNLALRLHPVGRFLLSPVETLASNLVGACLAGAAIGGLAYATTAEPIAAALALASVAMAIPISGAFDAYHTGAWPTLSRFTWVIGTVGVIAAIRAFAGGMEAASPFLGVFALGVIAFGWVAHFLVAKYQ